MIPHLFVIFISGLLWCGAFPGWIVYATHFKINVFTQSHCKFNFAYFFTRHYSSAILTIMCVEKFCALYFPLLTKRLCTVKTTKMIVFITALIYIAYESQCFFVLKVVIHGGLPECWPSPGLHGRVFKLLDTILYSFGPFTIMILTNAAIIYKLMSVKIKEAKGGAGQAISKSATKGTAMLIVVSLMFIILTGPMAVALTLKEPPSPPIILMSFIMQYLNHCINGVLYCIVGSKFRRELFKILPCCRRNRVADQSFSENGNSLTAVATPI